MLNRTICIWICFGIASLVVQSWVTTADNLRSKDLLKKLDSEEIRGNYYRDKSDHLRHLWGEEVKLNDIIERRFPNGLPPEVLPTASLDFCF